MRRKAGSIKPIQDGTEHWTRKLPSTYLGRDVAQSEAAITRKLRADLRFRGVSSRSMGLPGRC